jgi:hypothetical protein
MRVASFFYHVLFKHRRSDSKVGERVTGSSKDLLELRDYFTAMLDYVGKGVAAGKSMDEIVKVAAVPGFERYEGTPAALEAAYKEVTTKP